MIPRTLLAAGLALHAVLFVAAARAQDPEMEPPAMLPVPTRDAADAPAQAAAEPEAAEPSARAARPTPRELGVLPSPGGDEPLPDASTSRLKKHPQRHLGFEAGGRGVFVLDDGYDPYSSNDLLPHLAIGATWTPIHLGAISAGFGAEYALGLRSGEARGAETSLTVHRAAIGLHARLALGRRAYAFVRAAPSLLHLQGTIDDAGLDVPLAAEAITWGLDATGGAALLIGRAGDPELPLLRVWLLAEIGYAFAGSAEMIYSPDALDDDPRQFGSVELPELRLAGVVNRVAVAITF